jgi:hypothetical protein
LNKFKVRLVIADQPIFYGFLNFCAALHFFSVLIAEVGEGVELIEDATDRFGFGEVATTGDGHDSALLGGLDRLSFGTLPRAVVDLVRGSKALVVFSVGFGDFDTGHGFGFRSLESGFALVWSIG